MGGGWKERFIHRRARKSLTAMGRNIASSGRRCKRYSTRSELILDIRSYETGDMQGWRVGWIAQRSVLKLKHGHDMTFLGDATRSERRYLSHWARTSPTRSKRRLSLLLYPGFGVD